MRVLIVEDAIERMYGFLEFFRGHTVTWVSTALDGIQALGGEKYDLVLLDHDLEPEHYDNLEEQTAIRMRHTGYDVAKFIADNKVDIGHVHIHSWNPGGAKNMHAVLMQHCYKKLSRQPYGDAMFDMLHALLNLG